MPTIAAKAFLRSLVGVVTTFLMAATVHAEPGSFRSFELRDRGALNLTVPRTWNDQMRERGPDTQTILFTPDRGHGFNVQLTPVRPPKNDNRKYPPEAAQLRAMVEQAASDMKGQVLETEIPVQELAGETARGWYFSATDKAPMDGEFKYLRQGLISVGDLLLAFTILWNDGAEVAAEDAMAMMKSVRHVGVAQH